MGMFSYIHCKYTLPKPENLTDELKDFNFHSLSFQTKDLDNYLELYEIREDGSLWEEHDETEYVPGIKNGKTFSERFGHLKNIKSWWEEKKLTTTIRFYELIRDDKYKNDYWYEVFAKFLDGKLVGNIELIEFKITDNTERKRRETEFWLKEKERDILFNKWYVKFFYVPYADFVRFVFRKYRQFKSLVNKYLPYDWKIERWLTPL